MLGPFAHRHQLAAGFGGQLAQRQRRAIASSRAAVRSVGLVGARQPTGHRAGASRPRPRRRPPASDRRQSLAPGTASLLQPWHLPPLSARGDRTSDDAPARYAGPKGNSARAGAGGQKNRRETAARTRAVQRAGCYCPAAADGDNRRPTLAQGVFSHAATHPVSTLDVHRDCRGAHCSRGAGGPQPIGELDPRHRGCPASGSNPVAAGSECGEACPANCAAGCGCARGARSPARRPAAQGSRGCPRRPAAVDCRLATTAAGAIDAASRQAGPRTGQPRDAAAGRPAASGSRTGRPVAGLAIGRRGRRCGASAGRLRDRPAIAAAADEGEVRVAAALPAPQPLPQPVLPEAAAPPKAPLRSRLRRRSSSRSWWRSRRFMASRSNHSG